MISHWFTASEKSGTTTMPLVWVLVWFSLVWHRSLGWEAVKSIYFSSHATSTDIFVEGTYEEGPYCDESSRRKGQDRYLLPISPDQALRLRSNAHKAWDGGQEDLTNSLHFAQISKATYLWLHTCQAHKPGKALDMAPPKYFYIGKNKLSE